MYSILLESSEKKTAKGIIRHVTARDLRHGMLQGLSAQRIQHNIDDERHPVEEPKAVQSSALQDEPVAIRRQTLCAGRILEWREHPCAQTPPERDGVIHDR